jgi:CubicO group peptidase (beta-lactamase class C family)
MNAMATILWLRLAWALALPALGDDASAHAVDDLRGRVQALVQPLLEKKQSVGVVVGVVEAGQTHVFGFGREALGGDKVPDGKTIFEIGSITKVFTSLALADMAQQSLVRLDDPVQRYLPKEVNVASRAGREITLEDLATHTSGLPRIPLKMVFLGVKSNDPYATYKEKDLYDFLKIWKPTQDSGTETGIAGMRMGLAWIVKKLPKEEGELDLTWHNGGTAGYSSFVGFIKESNTAVVILSNTGPTVGSFGVVDTVGVGVLKLQNAKENRPK